MSTQGTSAFTFNWPNREKAEDKTVKPAAPGDKPAFPWQTSTATSPTTTPPRPSFGQSQPPAEKPNPFARPSTFGTSSTENRTSSLFAPRPESPAPALRPAFGSQTTPAVGQSGSALAALAARMNRQTTPAPAPAPAPRTSSLFENREKSTFAAPVSPLYKDVDPAMARREMKVSDEEFVQLRDFIYQQCGIYIAESRKYLVENRLSSRLRELGLHSFGEYYNYLRFDSSRGTELNRLYESMTTNETSFFRNGPQLDVFRDYVLKNVLDEARAKGQRKLRIWSAGCSSGEEPYTIAIILSEVLKQEISSWDIKITANDLSPAVLKAARQGVYNDYSLRTTPPDMVARYFTKEEHGLYKIDQKLKRLITFDQINLSDKAQVRRVEPSQIVFCRNVIIYFDDDMKKNVISSFYDNLLPGGFLIIGHSESLHNISRTFKPEHHVGTIVYKKQA